MIPIRHAGPCQGPTDAIPAGGVSGVARFLIEVWAALRRLCRSRTCQILVAAGLVNLAGGLVFGLGGPVPTTRVLLDVVYANFAMVVWALAVYAGGATPARSGRRLAAEASAVVVTVLVAFLLAGSIAVVYQLARGQADIEWDVYGHGLVFNLGWNACHLAILALCFHRAVARLWIAATATCVVYVTTNLAFDHDLLRFGAPIDPWSDIGGYGANVGPHLALGIYWTGLCFALLAGVHLLGTTSVEELRRRLTPAVAACGWGGVVVALVSGAWMLSRPPTVVVNGIAPSVPQPVYSRLDLNVEIHPQDGWVRSRGSTILVNPHDVAIADLHFVPPSQLTVESMSLTGELLTPTPGNPIRSYRLNRPLEPQETLKVDFDFRSPPGVTVPGVVPNGTVLRTMDVLASLGSTDPATFFATAPAAAFRVRLGTSLDQVAVAPGLLTREWKENGSRYFEYQAPTPIPPLVTFHSGRFALARDLSGDVPIEIYHHPAHASAAAGMFAHGHARLAAQGVGYPHAQLRIVEVPDWRPATRPPGLLGFKWRRAVATDQPILGGVLAYSELAALATAAE